MIVVMIPTYNESQNIPLLIEELLGLKLELHILVVDDCSPDGTYKIVEECSNRNYFVHLLLRKNKRGRGSAGVDGFKKALEMGAEIIIEMDADFSHPTRYIPILIEALKDVDVVFASRLVKGGGEVNRSFGRVAVTKGANLLTRTIMRYPIHDCTAGYRLFRKKVLEKIELDSLSAEGPAIVGEVLYRIIREGFKVREVPYIYEDRRFGQSSLRASILFDCLKWLIKLKFRQLFIDREKFQKAQKFYSENPPESAENPWSPRS